MLNFENIKSWYDHNIWTAQMVQVAVTMNVLTQEQANEIIGGDKK